MTVIRHSGSRTKIIKDQKVGGVNKKSGFDFGFVPMSVVVHRRMLL